MLIHFAIELALGFATFFGGALFFQFGKRDRYMRREVCHPAFLHAYVAPELLDIPDPYVSSMSQGAGQNELKWLLILNSLLKADEISQRRPRMIIGLFLAGVLTGSYFLGVVYLFINLAILVSSAAVPIQQSTEKNARDHVLTVARILDKWSAENPSHCEEWIQQAKSLRPLYDAVKAARAKAAHGGH